MDQHDIPRLDKSAFTVSSLFDKLDEKAYWLSRTPQERLRHVKMLRRINYGPRAAGRLQRILEVAEFKTSSEEDLNQTVSEAEEE